MLTKEQIDVLQRIGPHGMATGELADVRQFDAICQQAALAVDLAQALKDMRTALGRMPMSKLIEFIPSELAERVNGLLENAP